VKYAYEITPLLITAAEEERLEAGDAPVHGA
jgi:hypothetical protein